MQNRSKPKLITSIVINSVLILLGLFALTEVLFRWLPGSESFPWYDSLTYYTNLSNMMLIGGEVTCLIQDIRELQGKETKWGLTFTKYIGVCTTLVTWSTVYFFVFASMNFSFGLSVSGNMWLLYHTVCPLGGALSYLFLDRKYKMPMWQVLAPIGFTVLYTAMVHTLYFAGGRIPYASDFTDEPLDVSYLFILMLGIMESIVTAIWAFLTRFLANLLVKKNNPQAVSRN